MTKKRWILVAVFVALLLLVMLARGFFTSNEPEYTYWEPALSPEGDRIAYESASESSLELFTMDLDTQQIVQLTNDEYPDWSPTWSPDGNRLAFVSSRDKNVDIYVIDLQSLETIRITLDPSDDINPSWGMDGAIYFNSNRTEAWEAYSIHPDSLVLRQLTTVGASMP